MGPQWGPSPRTKSRGRRTGGDRNQLRQARVGMRRKGGGKMPVARRLPLAMKATDGFVFMGQHHTLSIRLREGHIIPEITHFPDNLAVNLAELSLAILVRPSGPQTTPSYTDTFAVRQRS
eukprot:9496804-Pyramimonas_sp.AAC.1